MNRQALFGTVLRLTAALPLPWIHILGAWIGRLLGWIPNHRTRRIAERNLTLCFPEWSTAERHRQLQQNLMETAKGFLELGPLWLWPDERVLALIQAPATGEEALAAAIRHQQGVILITPHLGAWETTDLYYSRHYPLTVLYRPSRVVEFDTISRRGRERFGGQLVPTDPGGIRALLKALRRGEAIGILPDQDIGSDEGEQIEGRVFVPFFGIAASTMTLVSRLAMKHHAPVFLSWAKRLPRGRGYVLHLRVLPEVTQAVSLNESVTHLNQAIEAAVRTLPEQYLWAYRRFRTRPLGEPKIY